MPGLGRLPKTHLGLAWPWAKARPCFNFCFAWPGQAKKIAWPWAPGSRPWPWAPGSRAHAIFFAWPGQAKQKLKHGLALAQGQARPKWVLGSRPRPGNKIYITYYILYIIKIITNQRKITTNQSPCPWRLATENFF